MRPIGRLFEIIQLLRASPTALTAGQIADALETSRRTIYRDIAALQAMRVPIEGEAGIGYVMRPGFDLPPLMFTSEEIDAVIVGLALVRRTSDRGLHAAAQKASQKIAVALPNDRRSAFEQEVLRVSYGNLKNAEGGDPQVIRKAIRDERKIEISYCDLKGERSRRTILPLAVIYYLDVIVVAAWCELRSEFRHFRVDRIESMAMTGERFLNRGSDLRREWSRLQNIPFVGQETA